MSDPANPTPEEKDFTEYLPLLTHELKSPLASLQALLKTVLDGYTGGLDAKTRHFLERALAKAREAGTVVSDLLEYQLSENRDEPGRAEVDLRRLVDEMTSRYSITASMKDIRIDLRLPSGSLFVRGDEGALEHLFRNLIENAVKFTPEKGRILVTLLHEEAVSQAVFTIEDTGTGIPVADLPRLFEPFFRSPKTRASTTGTGLGLSIVKRIAESHGGSVAAESVEDKGSTFTVRLPVLRAGREEARKRRHVVIVGGVTAGPKTAARLRRLREDIDITLIDKSEFLSYTGCSLPTYVADRAAVPRALMTTADHAVRDVHFFASIKNIVALNRTEVLRILRESKTLEVFDLSSKRKSLLPYDVLVLATGSKPLRPKIPGIDRPGIHALYTLEDAEAVKSLLQSKRAPDVCLIGGGLIGITLAESLVGTGARVTIVEAQDHILGHQMGAGLSDRIMLELGRHGIKVLVGRVVQAVETDGERYVLRTAAGLLSADLVLVCAGVLPNTDLAREAGLAVGESGGIVVDASLRSSDASIYAVGDCAESVSPLTGKVEYWPLGSVSTKMGRSAADAIAAECTIAAERSNGAPAARRPAFAGSLGTAMFKVFSVHAARTGLTAEAAARAAYDAEAIIASSLASGDRRGNGVAAQFLSLVVDRKTRRLLGAEGCGNAGIISRVQILSTAIAGSLTVDEVFRLDLGYAPFFNEPIDFVQTACLVAANVLDGLVAVVSSAEFRADRGRREIVDVSPPAEYAARSIPGSINIPLESIRSQGLPFERDAAIVLVSTTGAGAYEAYRYLSSKGYAGIRVLEGGYLFWEE